MGTISYKASFDNWDYWSYIIKGVQTECPISEAVSILGWQGVASACVVSVRAVRKWVDKKRLPRTEATGETNYSERIARASGIDKERLLATARKPQ